MGSTVHRVSKEGKRVVEEELKPPDDFGLFRDSKFRATGGVEVGLLFEPGRSLKDVAPLKKDARRTGRPVYYTTTDEGGVRELLPKPIELPVPGEFRKVLTAVSKVLDLSEAGSEELVELGLHPPASWSEVRSRLKQVVDDTLGSSNISTFHDGVTGLSPADAVYLSIMLGYAEDRTTSRKGTFKDPDAAGQFLVGLNMIVLRRLGRELHTRFIDSPEMRGLIVRDGLYTDVEAEVGLNSEFIGKTAREIDGMKPSIVRGCTDYLEDEMLESKAGILVRNTETAVLSENATRIVDFYADRWKRLNAVWRKGKVGEEFLQAFSGLSRLLVVQPWDPDLEYGYGAIILSQTELSEDNKSYRALLRTVTELNDGLSQKLPDGRVATKLEQNLSELRDALREEVRTLPQLDGTPDLDSVCDDIDVLLQRPELAVKLAREWRTDV